MSHVSFETARKLQAAGFPQPQPAAGQVWYYPSGMELYVLPDLDCDLNLKNEITSSIDEVIEVGSLQFTNSLVYAQTATDILEQLGSCYSLTYDFHCGFGCVKSSSGVVNEIFSDDPPRDNPAEACAEAWLKLNPKLQTFEKLEPE